MPCTAPQLRSLSCIAEDTDHNDPNNIESPDFRAVAKFSRVTELALSCFIGPINFHALSSLELQKLSMTHCPGAYTALMLPGILANLKILRIVEEKTAMRLFYEGLVRSSPQVMHDVEELDQVQEALESLPRFVCMSGQCKLFILMSSKMSRQHNWSRVKHSRCQSSHAQACTCFDCLRGKQEWAKVH